jgi:hypothetical protein
VIVPSHVNVTVPPPVNAARSADSLQLSTTPPAPAIHGDNNAVHDRANVNQPGARPGLEELLFVSFVLLMLISFHVQAILASAFTELEAFTTKLSWQILFVDGTA